MRCDAGCPSGRSRRVVPLQQECRRRRAGTAAVAAVAGTAHVHGSSGAHHRRGGGSGGSCHCTTAIVRRVECRGTGCGVITGTELIVGAAAAAQDPTECCPEVMRTNRVDNRILRN